MKKIIRYSYLFEETDKRRFKKWCIDKGYKQVDVADKLGISFSYLQAIICGDRVVSDDLITKFKNIGFCIRKSREDK